MGFFDILANTAGSTIPGMAISTGMGLLMQKNNDARQLKMQQQLQNMQIAGQQQMTDYNMEKQLQMWKDTSYGAQKEQMKMAGINPALMYGMGGGGGQTTGQANGNVSSGNAPTGGQEMAQAMGITSQAAQLSLLEAQRKNIEADTANKQANTITTGEQGLKLQYENIINDLLTNRDKDGNVIQDEAHDKDRVLFQQKIQELRQLTAQTGNTEQDTIKKIADIAQGWQSLSLEERKVKVAELTAGEQKDEDQIINLISMIAGIVERFIPLRISPKTSMKPKSK